jgi:intracellular sulfur oxidation DsrE/DsrF family protein
MPNVAFTACGNTMDTMKRAEGKDVPLLPKVKIVTAGVTRIMELQEEGWSYIRP